MTLLTIEVVISALNIILFLTAILPAKIKTKMFKSTLDTKRCTLIMLLFQALFSLVHAFFNFAQSTDDAAQLAKNAHNTLIVLSHKLDKEIVKINNEYY